MGDVEMPSSAQSPSSSEIPRLKGVLLEKLIKFCENCPGVNYVYDLLFDEAPDPQSVKELLNLFALISNDF